MIPRPPAPEVVAHFTSDRRRRLATRALVGGLSPRGARSLSQGLLASEPDRLAYGRLVELFRVLEGGPELTSGQHERILDRLRERVAAESGRRRGLEAGRLLPRLAPALAALLLVLLAASALLRLAELEPGFAPRGERSLAVASGAGRVGLKALCFRAGQLVPPPPRDASGLEARCRLHDELQLVLTHTAGYSRLLLLGLMPGADARELYYFPVPPTGRSGPAPRDLLDGVVERAVRLEVNHRPGPLRIVGLFSHAPIEASQLHAWLRSLDPSEPAAPLLTRVARGLEIEVIELRIEIEGTP
jgi:hypothetical protein